MSYLVVELQTYADGSVGHIEWDFYITGRSGIRFHAVLSAAAVSEVPVHAASLLDSTGRLLDRKCYDRRTVA